MGNSGDFHDWFIYYRGKLLDLVECVRISGDKEDVEWLTVPCGKCIIQATCYEVTQMVRWEIEGTIGPEQFHIKSEYNLATINKVCMPLLKWIYDANHYIENYEIDYFEQYMIIKLLPRYG